MFLATMLDGKPSSNQCPIDVRFSLPFPMNSSEKALRRPRVVAAIEEGGSASREPT